MSTTSPSGRPGFRSDIEGLRAFAVVSVMLWHADIPGVRGGFVGVDSFFVISGFLMTMLLARELEQTGRISLTRFYARRARRLLPAACLVLVATTVAAHIVFHASRWATVAWDAAWAALYVANWRFIGQATDYMAADRPPSPVQHFWSLSVEEQFYLGLPALFIAAFWLATHVRRRRHPDRTAAATTAVGAVLVALFGASLIWCLTTTTTQPERAYFSTFTRVWELALGGFVAVIAMRGRRALLGPRTRQMMAAAALLMLVAVMVWLPEGDPFPGWRALLPTLPTAALIAIGTVGTPTATFRLLSLRPLVWIGGLSYSLYLWHWPVLLIGARILHTDGVLRGADVAPLLAVTLALSWLSYTLVENPVRRRRVSLKTTFGMAAALTAVTVSLAVAVSVETTVRDQRAQRQLAHAPGARVVPNPVPASYSPTVRSLQPQAIQDPVTLARSSMPTYWSGDCFSSPINPRITPCEFGDPGAARHVYLVGDSHAGMWQGAVDVAARRLGFRATAIIKHDCGFADATLVLHGGPNTTCRQWTDAVVRELLSTRPDAVIVATSPVYKVIGDGDKPERDAAVSRERFTAALAHTWNRIVAAGIDVYAIAPIGPFTEGTECAIAHGGDGTECTIPRSTFTLPARTIFRDALAQAPDVRPVNLLNVICPRSRCLPVEGELYILRDPQHLSRQYSESLGGHLATRLRATGLEPDRAGSAAVRAGTG